MCVFRLNARAKASKKTETGKKNIELLFLTTTAVGALVCFIDPRVSLLVRCLNREDCRKSGRRGLLARKREVVRSNSEMGLTGLRGSVVRLGLRHTEGWRRRRGRRQCSERRQVIKCGLVQGVMQGINAAILGPDSNVVKSDVQWH